MTEWYHGITETVEHRYSERLWKAVESGWHPLHAPDTKPTPLGKRVALSRAKIGWHLLSSAQLRLGGRESPPPPSDLDPYAIAGYVLGMRVKTSVTLAEETVRAIDEMIGRKVNRSRFIEEAVLAHLERQRRRLRDQRDLKILNRNADRLNEEVEDVLAYQAEP